MDIKEIEIREFRAEDISAIADYFCGCKSEFLASLGIDKRKIPIRDEFIAKYSERLDEKGILPNFVVATLQSKSIGHCNVNNIVENESAMIHGHLWSESLRNQGIGMIATLKAANFFIEKLNLRKIIFNIPKMNRAANKMVEKLGIPKVGSTTYEFPLMLEPLDCHQCQADSETLSQLKEKWF